MQMITVRVVSSEQSCGFIFEEKKHYLIYAHAEEVKSGAQKSSVQTIAATDPSETKKLILSTGICTGTKKLSDARSDIIELRKK